MNIKDFKFKPDCPSERVDQAISWLKARKDSFKGTANFAVIDQKGELDPHIQRVCHGNMATTMLVDRCLIATENATTVRNLHMGRNKVDVESREPFLKWLVEESFWAPYIMYKDLDFCRDYGFVLSADIPCPLLQNFLITTRHFYECNDAAFAVFKDLCGMNVNKTFAYLVGFCSILSTANTPASLPGAKQIYSYGSHRAWDLPKNLQTLKNIINGDFGETFKRDCDPKYHYRKYGSVYGGKAYGVVGTPRTCFTEEVVENEEVKQKLAALRGDTKVKKDVANPFKSTTTLIPSPGLVTYKELVEVIVPHLKEERII